MSPRDAARRPLPPGPPRSRALLLPSLLLLGLLAVPSPGWSTPGAPPTPLPTTAPSATLPGQIGPPIQRLGPAEPAPALEQPRLTPTEATAAPGLTPWPPPAQDEEVVESTFVRRLQQVTLALALVSFLVWALLRFLGPGLSGLRLPARPGRPALLTILERHSLGPGRGLLVVRAGGRHLLLGMTEHGIRTLAELGESPAQDQGPALEAPPGPEAGPPPSPNLVLDVLQRHLAALPGLEPRQRGSSEPR